MTETNRTAAGKLDHALTGAATSVRDAGEAIDHLAERTAAKLDSTAAYVRRYDPASRLREMREAIRRRPAASVAGAAAAGFLFGMAALTVSGFLSIAAPAPQAKRG